MTASSETTTAGPSRWPRPTALDAALVAVITLVGIGLRVPSFSDSLNGDEMATYFVATQHGVGRIIDIVQGPQEVTPPLYLIVARLTQGIGDPLDALRWAPILAGVACIPLTYLLGLRTLGRREGLAAAAVMALSPFMVFYSTEARAYSLMMVFCLASTLALLKALDGHGRRWWAVYAVLSCAAMYTHYTAAFVLAGQAVWALLFHRRAWPWLLGANAAAGIAWLPWLSSYRADQSSPGAKLIGALQPFDLSAFKTDTLHWAVGHPLLQLSVREMPGRTALALLGIGAAVGLVGLGLDLRRRGRLSAPGAGLTLVAVLALSSPVIAGLYSAVSVSVFLPRNLIASSPGLALAFGALVARPTRRALWIPATALLLAGFAVGGARMLSSDSQRPDYKGVAAFIADRGGPGAVTVDSPGLSPGPLSQLDAPAAPGLAQPTKPTILRLGRPTRAAQLYASRPGGPGQFAVLPIPSPRAIARQAVRLSHGREIFLVNPGAIPYAQLRGALPVIADPQKAQQARIVGQVVRGAPVGRFVRALPRGYRSVEMKVFPGFFGTGEVAVYVLRRDGR